MITNAPRNFTRKGIFSLRTTPILEFEAPICSLIIVVHRYVPNFTQLNWIEP